jgi:GxxExxY protein
MTQIGNPGQNDRTDPQTYAIIGAAMEAHRVLGSRFLEPVYQSALEMEFGLRGVPYAREIEMLIYYKEVPLSIRYRADFVCYGEVLVELKAIDRLTSREDSQVINYLAASGLHRGLLLNFGAASLQFKRFLGLSSLSMPPSAKSVQSVGNQS